MKLKRYLKNLWRAITGKNPFEAEMQEEQRRCQAAEEKTKALGADVARLLGDRTRAEQEVKNYQNLTENLRQHLVDKDVVKERMKKDYQKRIEEYNLEIDRLRTELRILREGKFRGE